MDSSHVALDGSVALSFKAHSLAKLTLKVSTLKVSAGSRFIRFKSVIYGDLWGKRWRAVRDLIRFRFV